MKALKIKIYQDLVNYRKPMSFKSGETYPLPPPSTVNGFLHNAISATEYIPMQFSIQGSYKSITSNLQTLYKFGGVRKDKGKMRDYWAVVGKTGIQRMVFYTNLLVGVYLIIHINSDDETLKKLENALVFPKEYLSLGRKEDLVRIDEIKIIEAEEKEDNWQGIKIKNPIYIPKQIAIKNELKGINYRLNSYYEIVDGFKKWDIVEMAYVEEGKIHNKVFVDNEENILFWHKNI